MSRISREQLYMEICNILAKRSTCYRQNVGALLTYQSRIISTGWNGPPAGEPHCMGQNCALSPSGGCTRSVHAEINAMLYAHRQLKNLSLFVSMSPCPTCAKEIIASGSVVKVYYNQEYRLREGIEILIKNNIEVFRITNAGHVINSATNELVRD